jgi:hypothetical protein
LKNSPSFFSIADLPPFFDDIIIDEEADDDGAELEEDAILCVSGTVSDSSHR